LGYEGLKGEMIAFATETLFSLAKRDVMLLDAFDYDIIVSTLYLSVDLPQTIQI